MAVNIAAFRSGGWQRLSGAGASRGSGQTTGRWCSKVYAHWSAVAAWPCRLRIGAAVQARECHACTGEFDEQWRRLPEQRILTCEFSYVGEHIGQAQCVSVVHRAATIAWKSVAMHEHDVQVERAQRDALMDYVGAFVDHRREAAAHDFFVGKFAWRDSGALALGFDDVMFENRVEDLMRDEVDIAVRVVAEPPQSLVARDLGTVRYVACASRDYARAHPMDGRRYRARGAHRLRTRAVPSRLGAAFQGFSRICSKTAFTFSNYNIKFSRIEAASAIPD
ncbi:hypothetical protein DFQ28_004534 [Apophysomyces sp. BC1034]|nr:hypothetical protein DFQ28_004534 [Apophysomyces sp. BC1034]